MTNRVGEQLGNYRLTRLLGEGAFAKVYLGEHIHLGTQAAVKVLDTRLTSEEMERFRNEARTIANLHHTNIVHVLDFGVQEGIPFLVMEYAPYGTLRQRHPLGTPVPPTTMLPYVKQVGAALQYAHDHHLVHRDIKPENMLLSAENTVLLSDFGISMVASSRSDSGDEVAGTIAYMAPEQLRGHPRPASDQYGLAVVVYEWLSGDRPFRGSFTEVASQQVLAPPPPLRQRAPGISPAIEEVVLTAMEKDPQQRFGSVRAFATALENAVQSQPGAQGFSVYAPNPRPSLPSFPPQSGGLPSDPPGSLGYANSPLPYQPTQATPPVFQPSDPPGQWRSFPPAPPPAPAMSVSPATFPSPPTPGGAPGPVFPGPRPPRNLAKLIALILAIVFILGGVSLGGYLILGHSSPKTASATPTPHPPTPTPLYQDTLTSNRGDWDCTSGATCSFRTDGYHIVAPDNQFIYESLLPKSFGDFVLDVQCQIAQGDRTQAVLVIGFRVPQNNELEGYGLLLFPDGTYLVNKYDSNGSPKTVIDQLTSSAIHQGLNQQNEVKIVATGAQLTVFINGQQVNQASDNSYSSGYIELGVIGSKTEGIFSNLLINKP